MVENVIDVPESYKYVLDRGFFEFTKACSNVSFFLSKHLDSADALDSDIFRRLMDRAVDACVQNNIFQLGVAVNLFTENLDSGELRVPEKYEFTDDNQICVYQYLQQTEV